MTILDQLADHARCRVAADRERISLEAMRELAAQGGAADGAAFAAAPASPLSAR